MSRARQQASLYDIVTSTASRALAAAAQIRADVDELYRIHDTYYTTDAAAKQVRCWPPGAVITPASMA